jgi:uncharacterized protein
MVKIISIDGGGIKGIVGSTILQEIESRLEGPLHEHVDVLTGTSTGGLISCGLTVPNECGDPKYVTQDIIDTYNQLGTEVFSRSFWHKVKTLWGVIGPKFPIEGLEEVLTEKFGETKLNESLTEVIMCTYDLASGVPVVFSSKDKELNQARMLDICMGTSSVPTYFPSVEAKVNAQNFNLIDGGIFAVNPALSAYALTKQRDKNAKVDIISIGNGNYGKTWEHKETKDWGLLEWASPVSSVILDSIGDAINYQTKILCEADGGTYTRLQFDLPEELSKMDNPSKKNMEALTQATIQYIYENSHLIQSAVDKLKK